MVISRGNNGEVSTSTDFPSTGVLGVLGVLDRMPRDAKSASFRSFCLLSDPVRVRGTAFHLLNIVC